MSREEAIQALPADIAEYVPNSLPKDASPNSTAEETGMYFGIAMIEWAIHEKGLHPEKARDVIGRALQHGATDAILDAKNLPGFPIN